jgi:YggT family protein
MANERDRSTERDAERRWSSRPAAEERYELESVTADDERRMAERRITEEPVVEEQRVVERRTVQAGALSRRRHVIGRVTQGVDYAFYLLYGLLGVRFVLALLGASAGAGFVRFINGITQPFYAPFSGIVERPAVNGGVLDFPLIIAVLAYVLLHVAVRGLLRFMAGERTAP